MGEVSLDLIHYDAVVDEEVSSFNRRTFQPFVSFKKIVYRMLNKEINMQECIVCIQERQISRDPPKPRIASTPNKIF